MGTSQETAGSQPAREPLHSLVYVSSAVEEVTANKLGYLLQRAKARNLLHGVTGVLLFDAGNFMQYIEGPQAGLAEIYRHIKRDPLHTGIIELCVERNLSRSFGNWAMGARVFNAPELAGSILDDDALEQRLGELRESGNAAATLLRGFWRRGQHLNSVG